MDVFILVPFAHLKICTLTSQLLSTQYTYSSDHSITTIPLATIEGYRLSYVLNLFHISGLGFFRIEKSMITAMLGTFLTYLIILIQMT